MLNRDMLYQEFADKFEKLYLLYNKRKYVNTDPIQFLYAYESPEDREIVGLIASSLAYGKVSMIIRNVAYVLDLMGEYPARFVADGNREKFEKSFSNFSHRFTKGSDLAVLLDGIRRVIKTSGSINNCFKEGLKVCENDLCNSIEFMIDKIIGFKIASFLLPRPSAGSACKRLNLFLRWMVRRDDVDPGGWEGVQPSNLLIPLDTHMYRICCSILMFSKRRQADLKTVREVTKIFTEIVPDDPVRYDFVLTRFGICPDLNMKDLQNFME